jgi:hypothetical protein
MPDSDSCPLSPFISCILSLKISFLVKESE